VKRILSLLLGGALLLTVVGCSTISVNHDYDEKADFASFKTFAWMAKPNVVPLDAGAAQQNNDLIDRRIRNSIEAELETRGMGETADNPDLLVIYHIGATDKIQVTDWGYRYSDYYWGHGGRNIDVHQYTEGTLIIDLVSAGTKDLVWRGTGTKVLEGGQKSPEELQAKINEVVFKIMQSYPPATGK